MWRLYTPPSLIPNSGSGINTLNVVRKPCDSSFQIECFSREGVPPKDVVPSKERSVSLECHRRKGVTPKVPVDPGPGLWGTAREGKGRFHTSILERCPGCSASALQCIHLCYKLSVVRISNDTQVISIYATFPF